MQRIYMIVGMKTDIGGSLMDHKKPDPSERLDAIEARIVKLEAILAIEDRGTRHEALTHPR